MKRNNKNLNRIVGKLDIRLTGPSVIIDIDVNQRVQLMSAKGTLKKRVPYKQVKPCKGHIESLPSPQLPLPSLGQIKSTGAVNQSRSPVSSKKRKLMRISQVQMPQVQHCRLSDGA